MIEKEDVAARSSATLARPKGGATTTAFAGRSLLVERRVPDAVAAELDHTLTAHRQTPHDRS